MATWTWNPLDKGADITLSGDDLIATNANNWDSVRALYSKNSGKWYWEITVNDNSYVMTGVGTSAASLTSYVGSDDYGVGLSSGGGWYLQDTKTFTNQGRTAPAVSNDDEVCVALDLDNGKLWIGVNGVWPNSGDPAAGTNPCFTFSAGTTLFPMVSVQTAYCTAAFLTSSFSYSVPSGFSGIADIMDYTTETATLTDTQTDYHLLESTSETTTVTDSSGRVFEVERSTTETATMTDRSEFYSPCKWSPIYSNSLVLFSNEYLTIEYDHGTRPEGDYYLVRTQSSRSSGKLYWEVAVDEQYSTTYNEIGVGDASINTVTGTANCGSYANGWVWQSIGQYGHDNVYTSGVPDWDIDRGDPKFNDTVMVALDLDNGKLWFGKNGNWNASGNPATGTNPAFTGLSGSLYPIVSFYYDCKLTANFGHSAFKYVIPEGFVAFVEVHGNTDETATITDIVRAAYFSEPITEETTITDSSELDHLVAYTSETATLTDVTVPHRTTYASTSETATITDANVAYHLVDPTAETATVTDDVYASSVIRKRVRFPNTQGRHIGLKFESTTDDVFAIYYLRHKMYKTRNLCSDQKHPNIQGNHIGLKLSNSGTDNFILMYSSQEHYMVDT